MIATIVPLKRLPRHSSLFDYAIPPEFEQTIALGQLVEIELRKTTQFGIVVLLSDTPNPDFAYKPITALVHTTPLFPSTTRAILRDLSLLYATSLATVYKTSALPIQKRKLQKMHLEPELNNRPPRRTYTESYRLYTSPQERAELFSLIDPTHTTLVLVPELGALETTHALLNQIGIPCVIWHSDLSDKEKFARWLQVRNTTGPLIVLGTRSALTLPFVHLDRIIMDAEHDEQYKSYDQQPKYHARDLVRLVGTAHACECVYASFSPSFELYYRILKEKMPCMIDSTPYHDGLLFPTSAHQSTTIRIIEQVPQPREVRVCAIQTEEQILYHARHTAEDIVILVQRKGYATMVVCKDCGHIETSALTGLPMVYRAETRMLHGTHHTDSRPLPLTCSACGSVVMLLRGIGTEKIASHFSTIFHSEGITRPIFRIDDNSDENTLRELVSDTPRLIVGTEKIFPYIRPHRTGLFIILDLDRYLAIPEFQSVEHVVHLLSTFNYLRKPDSQFIIETHTADKPIFKLFSERDRIYRSELNLRQKLGYPPYQSMIKYTLSSPHRNTAHTQATQFREDVQRRLTSEGITATISEIYETHPAFHQRMYRRGMLIKTSPANVLSIAQRIHPYLPMGCVVDVQPLSIFSP